MGLYLGIDFGTSGCRACVIDADARIRAEASHSLPDPLRTASGIEQDPQHWWAVLTATLDRLSTRLPMDAITAIAVDGTSATLLLCTTDGEPLTPALMYNDIRAGEQARRIERMAPADCAVHGAGSSLAKLLYLQGTPAARRARFALHQSDWLLGRLAGRYGVTDENNALKLGYDPLRRCWPPWLDSVGVSRGLLPEVLPPGQVIGRIAAIPARRWGLAQDTRIVSGTTDSTAGFIATGAGAGEAVTSLGSTLVLKICGDRPVFAPRFGVYSHRLGNTWLVGGASNTGGAVLRRFFSPQEIDTLSEALRPDRPTGLDYYPLPATGERFPVNDPECRPRLEPRPADDRIFFQAILEGIAAIERRGYRLLETLGAPYPARVHSVGGGAANAAWRQIREDRLRVPVLIAAHPQAAYGAALLARQGSARDGLCAEVYNGPPASEP
ncbi:MAG: FGGY-family carbohydrate kinase [Gammaproteobacteria bacterium]